MAIKHGALKKDCLHIPDDAVVKKIKVLKGDKVEKNTVLIELS